jgi:hypothetical protein
MHRQESSVLGLDVLDPFIASPKKLAFNFPNKVSVDHVPPNNDRSLYSRSVPAQIKQIQLGNYHVMALTNQGEVFTWGWGEQGQLGHGDDLNQPLPKLVETLREVLYIGAGTQFSMALTYYGELYAWGHNDMGQLGIGNTTMQKSPVRVKKVQNVLHFACGTSHAVAVTWEGEGMQSVVWQWGPTEHARQGANTAARSERARAQGHSSRGMWRVAQSRAQSLGRGVHVDTRSDSDTRQRSERRLRQTSSVWLAPLPRTRRSRCGLVLGQQKSLRTARQTHCSLFILGTVHCESGYHAQCSPHRRCGSECRGSDI